MKDKVPVNEYEEIHDIGSLPIFQLCIMTENKCARYTRDVHQYVMWWLTRAAWILSIFLLLRGGEDEQPPYHQSYSNVYFISINENNKANLERNNLLISNRVVHSPLALFFSFKWSINVLKLLGDISHDWEKRRKVRHAMIFSG